VLGRRTEEQVPGLRALEMDLQLVLPRVAHGPEQLEPVPETADLRISVGSRAISDRKLDDLEVLLRCPEQQVEVAEWIEVAGTYAMFDGPQSPVTQTFGLGMLEPPTAEDMDTLEGFFRERGAPVAHEVSPMADKSILEIARSAVAGIQEEEKK